MPDVVGDSRERAMKKLNDRRLTVAHPISYQASCEEAGRVIRQQPDEDARVPAGTAVALVVASPGTEQVKVPRLVGVRLPDAERASRERFKIGKVEKRPTDERPPDTILEQSPNPGTVVAPGCPIDVVVALEIPPVSVPDFRGMTVADVQRQLQRTSIGQPGLTPGSVSYKQGHGTPGTVIEQNPAPGALVKAGTRLNLVVIPQRQAPPPDNEVSVPNVTGMLQRDAVAVLQKWGLGYTFQNEVTRAAPRRARLSCSRANQASASNGGP